MSLHVCWADQWHTLLPGPHLLSSTKAMLCLPASFQAQPASRNACRQHTALLNAVIKPARIRVQHQERVQPSAAQGELAQRCMIHQETMPQLSQWCICFT